MFNDARTYKPKIETLSFILIGGYASAYEDGTVCSETSAYKIQTPGNYAEESI
jgi:hypothetical protein